MFEIKDIKTEIITEEEFMQETSTIELAEKTNVFNRVINFINSKKNKKTFLKDRLKNCIGDADSGAINIELPPVNPRDYIDLLIKYKANQAEYDKMDRIDWSMVEAKKAETNRRLKKVLDK